MPSCPLIRCCCPLNWRAASYTHGDRKAGAVSAAEECARVVAARAQPPPRTSGNVSYWDGTGPLSGWVAVPRRREQSGESDHFGNSRRALMAAVVNAVWGDDGRAGNDIHVLRARKTRTLDNLLTIFDDEGNTFT